MTKLHHAAVCTTDIDRSMQFWREGLGFREMMDHEFEGDWPTLFEASTNHLRSIFQGDPDDSSGGIVELVEFDPIDPADDPSATPRPGFFLLSVYCDLEATLVRLWREKRGEVAPEDLSENLIVQLGTNWMDRSLTDAQMSGYLDRFVSEARRGSVQEIVWITPPDSSRLRRTQGRVHALIRQAAKRDNFQLVDSREVTHYVAGKTGGDGIHYNNEASEAWARRIQGDLDSKLSRSARELKFSRLKRES